MLLINLAGPEWVSVECHQKIIGDIMCMVPRNVNVNANISQDKKLVIFKNPCISIIGNYYSFSWGFVTDKSVLRNSKPNIQKSPLVAMEHLVKTVNTEFPPFHSFFNFIIYCKISRRWVSQNITVPNKGLHILMLPGSNYINYGNVFECGQGILIAYAYVCDGKKDCPGDISFDEMICICKKKFVLSRKCKYVMSKEVIKHCSLFYLTLKDGTCHLYGLVKIHSSLKINHAITCKSDSAISLMLNNSMIIDCLSSRHEEKQIVFRKNPNKSCQEYGQLPCKGSHMECYSITEIYIYRLDKNNFLIACNTGEHVANCRLIQCNMKFKCPRYYCIPWSYVCDGKWDCPGGNDELKELKCGTDGNCSSMFKCIVKSVFMLVMFVMV